MREQRCERCGGRLRFRSNDCRHCGRIQEATAEANSGSRWLRVFGYSFGLAFALAVVLLLGPRVVDSSGIADWYAEMAIQHLPRQFSSFAPAETATGAFSFCIRRVVKDALESTSVATFPSAGEETTTELGAGRYRVESVVHEDRVSGDRVTHTFRCVARYDRAQWVLENLSVGGYAQAE
jgi:hypothetical protein